jgi:hypothetical protein
MRSWFGTILAALVAPLLLCGCFALAKTPEVQRQTVVVPAATNIIVTVTNTVSVLDRQVITNWVTNVIATVTPSFAITNSITNWIYTPSPVASGLIQTLGGVNTLNPTPTGPPIAAGLGILSAALAALARWKTKQAAANGNMLSAVIAGVEEAAHPETKAAIAKAATLLGVAPDLHEQVKERTEPDK